MATSIRANVFTFYFIWVSFRVIKCLYASAVKSGPIVQAEGQQSMHVSFINGHYNECKCDAEKSQTGVSACQENIS